MCWVLTSIPVHGVGRWGKPDAMQLMACITKYHNILQVPSATDNVEPHACDVPTGWGQPPLPDAMTSVLFTFDDNDSVAINKVTVLVV